ncbi:hypothetical protein [Actinomadura macra]|uniref:hypothetical protein n=1 Tax=Actinomadura macra TaxID=46164 RepID=UPI00082CF1D8|nr:hypothetical protein [Actinomadura macra]
MEYERTGGFAGVDVRVTVDESGTVVLRTGRFALTPAELRDLRGDLHLITTHSSSRAGCDIADHFTYMLAHHAHRATRCLLPSDWRPAVTRLDGLAARGGDRTG